MTHDVVGYLRSQGTGRDFAVMHSHLIDTERRRTGGRSSGAGGPSSQPQVSRPKNTDATRPMSASDVRPTDAHEQAAGATEPTAGADEAAVDAREAARRRAREAAVSAREAAVSAGEPAVGAPEAVVRGELAASPREPAVRPGEPAVRARESAFSAREAAVRAREAAVRAGRWAWRPQAGLAEMRAEVRAGSVSGCRPVVRPGGSPVGPTPRVPLPPPPVPVWVRPPGSAAVSALRCRSRRPDHRSGRTPVR